MAIELFDHQKKAIQEMKNGCILCGGVGSGKSRTALAYYFVRECGGKICDDKQYHPMKYPKDLYIITTAHKRDKKDWEGEMLPFRLSSHPELSIYKTKVVVDSWNNIQKYTEVENAFFILDEQRLVGSGAWVKAFYKIAKRNNWILLSATPGDTWSDYIPVFVANGFYRNKSHFEREHIVYNSWVKYRKVERYLGTKHLTQLRDSISIDMEFKRNTIAHHKDIFVPYDIATYKDVMRNRWDPFKNEPIKNASRLCYILRKLVNADESRITALLELIETTPRAIIFYNFDYELEILKGLYYGEGYEIAEWNGHNHQPIPDSDKWVYLVQYTAGAEGWNCIKTDTIIFFSQNYSYKIMEQSAGRIDRLNTLYVDLYYYHIKSRSGIDLAITRALNSKKQFNARKFTGWSDDTKPVKKEPEYVNRFA